MRKVFVLLLASSIMMLMMPLMFTSVASATVCPISPPGVLPRGEGCRGACGGGCPSTCTDLSDIFTCGSETPGGIHYVCKYTGVIMCGTHQGCRAHDSCYDACAAEGVSCPNPLKLCCLACDATCVANYGSATCASWALGGGPFDGYLVFADAPTLTACGANAHCSGGACQCDDGYHNCDGDWSNGCECPPDMWCEDSECVPEASTLVLFATGLLCLAGYVGLKRRKTK